MRLLLTSEACRLLRVSPKTMRELVRAGTVPVVTMPGMQSVRFREDQLAEVIQRNTRRRTQ